MARRRRSRFALSALVSAAAVAVCACGGTNKPATCKADEIVNLDLESSKRVNRDAEGDSRSTEVRIYQLSDALAMQTAGFDALWSSDERAVLGKSLLGSDHLSIVPNDHTLRKLARNPQAKYLAVIAQFRRTETDGSWRAIVKLPPTLDPCALSDDASRGPVPPLAVRVFMQDYWLRAQTNFYMPLPTAAGPATESVSVPVSGSTSASPAGGPVEGWVTPDASGGAAEPAR